MINLRGEKVRLRALEPDDLEVLYKWENNPEFWVISNTSGPYSKYLLEQFIEASHMDIYQSRQIRLMISLVEDSTSVGAIDLFDFDPLNQRVGVGIVIADEKYRLKGYASESIDLVIDYCFNCLGLKQIYCNILSNNTESIFLFESKGFSLVGSKKEWIRSGKSWLDENLYQLIGE